MRDCSACYSWWCSGVSAVVEKSAIFYNSRTVSGRIDPAAEFEANISADEMLKLVKCCCNVELPGCGELVTAQVLYEVLSTHQKGIRHEDVRAEIFAFLFVRVIEVIGPNGMLCGLSAQEGGKTNKNGHLKYGAVLPHTNPLLCTLRAAGGCFLWRCMHHTQFAPTYECCTNE